MTVAPVRRSSPDADRPAAEATLHSSQGDSGPSPQSSGSNAVTNKLSEWALASGIKHPNVRIATGPSGRSLVATSPISASDALLRVPLHLALVVDAVSPDPPPLSHIRLDADSDAWVGLSWELRLGLVLLNEARRGTDSPWAAYTASLPEEPSAALLALHTPREQRLRTREQLGRVGLLETAAAYCASVRSAHEKVSAALEEGTEKISPKDFCWAAACAQSRAFALPGVSGAPPRMFAMLPAVDCGNHSASARVRIEVDEEAGELVVRAGADVEEGCEVFLNYGTKTPADLVLFYGFVEAGSPDACVPVGPECAWEAQADDETAELSERKDSLLEQLGINDEDNARFVLGMHEVDPRLMMLVRVAVANEEEVSKMEGMDFSGSKCGSRSVGLRNEVAAWKCIEEHCRFLLQEVGDMQTDFETKAQGGSAHPYSCAWEWGADADAPAEALFRFERNRVLDATIERLRHFREMSEKIGIVCTVLMPPSQSLLKADLFDEGAGAAGGIHQF